MANNFSMTTEQIEIVNRSCMLNRNETLMINAFAGTGKTSTLVEIAKANRHKKFLYVAFNNAVVKESKKKFPDNVTVATLHSLAIKILKINVSNIKNNDYDIVSFAELFGLDSDKFDYISEALKYYKEYCASDTIYPETLFVSKESRNFTMLGKAYYLDFIKFLFEGKIQITHDFYLKRLSLATNELKEFSKNFDYFLLDEMQDSNPVSLAIFKHFEGAKILVGDKHQQIYQFRGSVNAMDNFKAEYKFYLTNTFRCNQLIVDYANNILRKYLDSNKQLISRNNTDNYSIQSVGYISRTNSSLIEIINIFMNDNIPFILTKKPKEVFTGAINMYYFIKGETEKLDREFKFLNRFNDVKELKSYIDKYNLIDLGMNLKIAKRYKARLFILYKYSKQCSGKNNDTVKIYLTTAHASKGLEWDKIILAKDFKALSSIKDRDELLQEANLLYVAYTRAKFEIEFLE